MVEPLGATVVQWELDNVWAKKEIRHVFSVNMEVNGSLCSLLPLRLCGLLEDSLSRDGNEKIRKKFEAWGLGGDSSHGWCYGFCLQVPQVWALALCLGGAAGGRKRKRMRLPHCCSRSVIFISDLLL